MFIVIATFSFFFFYFIFFFLLIFEEQLYLVNEFSFKKFTSKILAFCH